MATVINKVWDLVSANRINTLHPAIRDKARAFLNKAEKAGIKLRITSAYRTYDEQDKLYAQGRTIPNTNVVTNAKAGYSNHNFGFAFDVVPMENGKANFNTPKWNKIGAIGKALGFEWGGDWKSIIDKPHFQMTFGNSLAQLRNLHDKNKTDNGGYIMV